MSVSWPEMLASDLLLWTLEDLYDATYKTFLWWLNVGHFEHWIPIPACYLENAARTDTVSQMIDRYGEESAVHIAVQILRKMNLNNTAEKLETTYAKEANGESRVFSSNFFSPSHITFFCSLTCRGEKGCSLQFRLCFHTSCCYTVCSTRRCDHRSDSYWYHLWIMEYNNQQISTCIWRCICRVAHLFVPM